MDAQKLLEELEGKNYFAGICEAKQTKSSPDVRKDEEEPSCSTDGQETKKAENSTDENIPEIDVDVINDDGDVQAATNGEDDDDENDNRRINPRWRDLRSEKKKKTK